MKWLKQIGAMLLIIFFPVGLLCCLLHTLGKDFRCFIGGICLVGIGILIGIYIVEPQIILNFKDKVIELLPFINM